MMSLFQLTNYPTPPYAARIHKKHVGTMMLFTAAWIGWLAIYAGGSTTRVLVSMGVYVFVILALAAPSFLRIRTLCHLLKETEFRICTECGFDLRTLPDEHLCPECGTAYQYDTLVKHWKEWRNTSAVFWPD